MNTRPLVSISCLTYNHVNYIKQCLDGFLMQKTSFEFEILIHDDASTDGTRLIIEEYTQQYPNLIKPVYQKKNQYSQGVRGIMVRFNFPRAKGKYIALCEGDDYWTDPLKLQKQVDFLEDNEHMVLCGTEVRVLQKNGMFKENKKEKPTIKIVGLEDVVKNYPFYTCSLVLKNKLFPIELFQSFNAGDHGIISYLLKFGKGSILPQVTAVYNFHGNGIASSLSHERYLCHRLSDRKELINLHEPHFKWIIKKEGLVIIWNYIKQAIRFRKEFIHALYSNRKLIIKFVIN